MESGGQEVRGAKGGQKREREMAGSPSFAPENAVRPGRNTLFLRRIEIVCTNVILEERDEQTRGER